jgi:hypothetical protein
MRRSLFRDSGLAHAPVKPLALSDKGYIIAPHGGAEAGNGEARIGCKASLDGRLRFFEPAEVRQGCREVELYDWMIEIDFNGAPRTRDGLLVAAQMEPSGADKLYPTVGSMVMRREAKRLIDMSLCFLGVTAKNLGKINNCTQGYSPPMYGERMAGGWGRAAQRLRSSRTTPSKLRM